MERAFVGVGSNVEPEKNILAALCLLLPEGLVRVSMVYRTEPVGAPGQPFFYNCVAELQTNRPPMELKHAVLRRVEEALGRRRGPDRCSPRQIDLDLVVYGDIEMDDPGLTLPDPEIAKRAFLAVPLAELAPGYLLPDGRFVTEAAGALGTRGMEALAEYADRLRDRLFRPSAP